MSIGHERFAGRTSPEIFEARASGALRAVLIPIGSVEQHGPHLPLGVDIWLAQAVAAAVAAAEPDVAVAESMPYGSSAHHMAFAGTMSLRPSTFIAVAVDLCASVAKAGLLPILVNGHGGNRGAMQVAVTELGAVGVRAAAFSYFDLMASEAGAILPDARIGTGHACALETALMMHCVPGSVRAALVPREGTPPSWPDPHLYAPGGVTVWRGFEEINPTGVIGTPADATPERGAALFEAAVHRSREAVRRLVDTYA